MEVTIFSREIIKPSSSTLHLLNPQNLSLFDQLTPVTYPEVLLFYPISDPDFDLSETLTRLKKALSETLTLYYPFSGRIKNNLYIDDFGAGVPYSEARINRRMSEFLEVKTETESLNKFVPFHPFCKEKVEASNPLISFQVTVFSCGGLAVGTSVCHKKSDGASLSHFLTTWAAVFANSPHKIVPPDHSKAATLFRPLPDLPPNALALMDQLWFKQSNYVTKRFFFDAGAIDTLLALAKSERVPLPSRNEAVSCFIWKHAMAASQTLSGTPRSSIAAHAVNVRPRMRSRSLENCTGNLFWWAAIATNPAAKAEIELRELVALTKEIMNEFDEDYLESMVGEDGFGPVSEFINQLEMMLSLESEKPDIFAFTNWKSFFNEVDFGWGKPVWVSAHGKVGDEFRNLIVLIDKQGSKEIEAFLTLEEGQMAVLESDSKFLAFASPLKTENSKL
ncbi:hypothetical protein TIFTF001_022021 [Ficus carica]|uniref:Uncharacterized protein n=1 Tax=Ficus carica TaxID=3494 RepID=A0AA88DE62_FICCA|nr:hypothetical protein TIFTF001_022021 [Ficus carica]